MNSRIVFSLVAAGAVASLAACQRSTQQRSAQAPVPDQGMACAAKITGAEFKADDVEQGARLTYKTSSSTEIGSLRGFASQQASPPMARAAGGMPSDNIAELPPVLVHVRPIPEGSEVTFTAINPSDTERVRQLVHWDADVQDQGFCSRLRVPQGTTMGAGSLPAVRTDQGSGSQDQGSSPPPYNQYPGR